MKKAFAIMLSLVLALSLCACSFGQQEKKESKTPPAYIGEWVTESFEPATSVASGTSFDAKMTISDDKNFTIRQTLGNAGAETNIELTGTYTAEGNTLSFKTRHSVTKQLGHSSETDLDEEFTGEVNGDKLTLTIPEGTKVVMKKSS